MRSLGVDKFKIDMVEEGVFADVDAVRAREKTLVRERGCSLNEETPPSSQSPSPYLVLTPPVSDQRETVSGETSEHLLKIAELERKVTELQTKLQSMVQDDQTNASTQTGTPELFNISDDDMDAEAPPESIPEYDITDKRFGVLRGKIDDVANEMLKFNYTKALGLGRHLQKHPKDLDAREDLAIAREVLAMKIARARCDGKRLGLDQPCLKLFEAIEKETGISKKLRKQEAWHALEYRKKFPYEDEEEVNGNQDEG
jgi:ribosomal protein S15P/S13E